MVVGCLKCKNELPNYLKVAIFGLFDIYIFCLLIM